MLMVRAGEAVDSFIEQLLPHMEPVCSLQTNETNDKQHQSANSHSLYFRVISSLMVETVTSKTLHDE
jgi:hypothetical protein